jgi:hypothetical protein
MTRTIALSRQPQSTVIEHLNLDAALMHLPVMKAA